MALLEDRGPEQERGDGAAAGNQRPISEQPLSTPRPATANAASPVITSLSGKSLLRQLTLLREENKRLRAELAERQAELERVVGEYTAQQSHFEQEIADLKQGHQLQIEEYQRYLREMLQENRQLLSEREQIEQRYQELQKNYQNAVEAEAHKMIAEAANTIILRPGHVPPLLHDVKKTIELQLRQEEDQQAATTLYLIRDAQRRAQQLAEELAREREQIARERQNLLTMQHSIREQAELRYKTLAARLGSRWSLALTLATIVLLIPLPLLQSFFYFIIHLPLPVSIYMPIPICLVFIAIFARVRAAMSTYYASAPRKSSPPPP